MDLTSPSIDVSNMQVLVTYKLPEIQRFNNDPRIATSPQALAAINNNQFDYVASYNWLQPADSIRRAGTKQMGTATIVVPGAPQRFVRWSGGQLEPDRDVAFADENRYFMREHPMEPLIRAVLLEGYEPMGLQTLDLVTDRHNLRQLFEFCKFRPGQRPPKSFNIKIERIGQRLVVFEQCSNIEHERRAAPIYGAAFEKKCTKDWSPLTRGTHYSILKYWLDPELCVLVRSAADCAQDWMTNEEEDRAKAECADVSPKPIQDSQLHYITHGYRKYDFKYIEMTTRNDEARFPDYIWDQSYFGRADQVYIGWNKDGACLYPQLFNRPELAQKLDRKNDVPYALISLRMLLKRLIEFIRHRPPGERYVLKFDSPNDESINTSSKASPGGAFIRLYKRTDTADTHPDNGILPASLKALLEEKQK